MSVATLKSPRAKRVLEYLTMHLSATTKEIEDMCQVAAARDYIRRLRDHGVKIQTVEEGLNKNGARVVRYKLVLDEVGH